MATGLKLLILVPTWNEIDNIERVIRRIVESQPDADILVVDENSRDGTGETVEQLKADLPVVHLMVRHDRPGLGNAIRDGYRYAMDEGYEAICIVDCDLQQDPADITRMCEAPANPDIVIGSRYLHDASFARSYGCISRWVSATGNAVVRLLFQFPFKDATTDFYLLNTRVLRQIPPDSLASQGYAFFAELKVRAWKAGFHVGEVAVSTYEREAGLSHRSWQQVYRFAWEILGLWATLFFTLKRRNRCEEINGCR